jgi:hypothetical protein
MVLIRLHTNSIKIYKLRTSEQKGAVQHIFHESVKGGKTINIGDGIKILKG